MSGYTFAYQPIVDVARREIDSFEALVRGPHGESAASVMGPMSKQVLQQFDIDARLQAVCLAARLNLRCRLNLNVLATSVDAAGILALSSAVEMAEQAGLPASHLVLELSEAEIVHDVQRFVERAGHCRALGVRFAIDDFGAGYSGLNLLADFQPDSIKLDMALVRGIESRGPRQAIVRGVMRTCEDLGIDVVAEGVETLDEYHWLQAEGIALYQGYLFARPGFETLPEVHWP